jgi:uncharacterized membrane protein YqjE
MRAGVSGRNIAVAHDHRAPLQEPRSGGTMTRISDHQSLPQLLEDLPREFGEVVRAEIDLAKAEISEKLAQAVEALGVLVLGAMLAIAALAGFMAAATGGVAIVLAGRGLTPMNAGAMAALIMAGVVGVAAVILIWRGLRQLKVSRIDLERTARSLARDAQSLREKL